jgi:mono/diheme cytochrome c family protein
MFRCLFARVLLAQVLLFGIAAAKIAAQAPAAAAPSRVSTLQTGKEIWEAGCVPCHGPDGKGQSQTLAAFERPETFPDFSDCPTSTVESDLQWRAVITRGGAGRSFSTIMPAFGELLTPEQIDKVIAHIRSLCSDDEKWPRGDLNLPRALLTEKAFPEDETVLTWSVNARGTPGVSAMAIYEHRLGTTAMFEVALPYIFTKEQGDWGSSFGDLAIGYKQTLLHNRRSGTIFSVGGEVAAPTGSVALGTGGQSTVFEAFGAFGQLFPGDSFVQVHTGVELPAHPDDVARAYYLRTAVGKTFSADKGLGRRWTPMLEVIGDRDLIAGAVTNWDVIPEIQIPLSRRLHILGNVGFRAPVNNTAGRQKQVLFYLLWDWADGPLTQGW